jgi:hypothetical protein
MIGDSNSNLRPLCEWKDEVVIVPYSGIQILDFGFALQDLTLRPQRFVERTTRETDGKAERTLIPYTGDPALDAQIEDAVREDDDEYSIKSVTALEPFLNQWVPVPVLRRQNAPGPMGEERFDRGPSTWSRLRVTELAETDPDTGHTHRVQLALDTNLADQQDASAFLAPNREDAEGRRVFRFCSAPKDMDWFIRRPETTDDGESIDRQRWVSDWLEALFRDFKRALRPNRPLKDTDFPHLFEHWARYLAMLTLIDHAVQIPVLKLADTVHARDAVQPVDVDLVLDIGNSRTCGILIENFPDATEVDLTKSYPLQLRDLGEPERHYQGLLESRVEFATAQFGSERFARASGRSTAFIWPSLVRVGPEAMRLVGREEGTETASGLSSPKRYLWDDTPYPQDWRFQGEAEAGAFPRVARSAMVHLNEAGDVIAQIQADIKDKLRRKRPGDDAFATRPRFSKSSLYGFMLQELLAHALVQINDPAARADRAQSDIPRRLKRVILTLPTATPIQEQAIIRSRAEGALKLLMAMQRFDEDAARTTRKPELIVEWDEASCTQLVYLYSEITQRFDGQLDGYLSLRGKPRPAPAELQETFKDARRDRPSLRMACIDIGGGTTDLMVMGHYAEANRQLHPTQLFREGFRIAGDDLVQSVVASIVLPRLRASVEAAGGYGVAERLKELFGANVAGPNQRSIELRRQFTLRILTPLAVAILTQAEGADEMDELFVSVAETLGTRERVRAPDDDPDSPPEVGLDVPDKLLAYLEDPMHQNGAPDWSLADVTLHTQRADVDAVIRDVLGQAVGNMCEIIGHLDCDVVLLTGRPSRLPAVRALVEEQMIVRPDRLVSMHTYRAGSWYPYRDPVTDRIADPKSTVAVGGMLLALAASRIPNFRVNTATLRMRSTARFIGEMENNGRIPASKVIFKGTDGATGGEDDAEIKLFNPMFLGSRQLPLERWTTTPLYQIDFTTDEARQRPVPLTIRLVREGAGDDEEKSAADVLRNEAAQEAFRIDEITDAEDIRMKGVRLKLNTLGQHSQYWLDTGVVSGI